MSGKAAREEDTRVLAAAIAAGTVPPEAVTPEGVKALADELVRESTPRDGFSRASLFAHGSANRA